MPIMGSSYSIAVPDKFAKDIGSGCVIEVLAQGWFAELKEEMVLCGYEVDNASNKFRIPMGATTGRTQASCTINGNLLKTGKSYIVKLFRSDSWFDTTLAISEPFRVVDFETMLTERLVQQSTAQVRAEQQRVLEEQKLAHAASVENAKHQMAADFTRTEKKFLRQHFDEIDEDGDNTIDVTEMMEYIRLKNGKITSKQISTMFKEADVDGSGDIDFSEFCEVMAKAKDYDASKLWGDLWEEVEGALSESTERPKKKARTTKSKI